MLNILVISTVVMEVFCEHTTEEQQVYLLMVCSPSTCNLAQHLPVVTAPCAVSSDLLLKENENVCFLFS